MNKCTKNKLFINPDIIKYNRSVINTTIIQAFCKIKYRTNSNSYKKLLNEALSKYEIYYNLKSYKRLSLKVS